MSEPEWLIRAAIEGDREMLSRFSCASPTITWEAEVEEFVRSSLIDWAFAPLAADLDPRLLLIFHRATGQLVGVVAHERKTLQLGRRKFSATKLEVIAVEVAWQGRCFASGERVSDVGMAAAIRDVTDRVPPRMARVFALVHEENERSIRLCQRHGFVEAMSRPTPGSKYRRLVTRHQAASLSPARKSQ